MKQFFSHPVVSITLKIVVSIVLLGGLLYYIDFKAVILSFQNANSFYLTVGLTLAILQLVVHFYRWRYLLRLVSKQISNEEVFTSLFVGFMAGFFTPAQIGEFAGRIASHPNVKKSHIVGITLIDKLYLAAITLIIGGAGFCIFIANYFGEYWDQWFIYPSSFFLALICVVFLYPEKIKELLKKLPAKIREHRFYEITEVIENEFHNKNAWTLFALTCALYTIILVEYYFLISAFGQVSLTNSLICSASVFFVKVFILPISFGDLGVRESAAVFFFQKVGVSAAVAFNASIVMSFANVIVPTAIGALLVLKLKGSSKK